MFVFTYLMNVYAFQKDHRFIVESKNSTVDSVSWTLVDNNPKTG